MTPMLDEFGDQRPELRLPEVDDRGEQICPRCEVPLDEFDGVGFVEVPVDAWEFDALAGRCKREDVHELRSRGWLCANHSRPLHLLRTCGGPQAHGWEACCGAQVELDDGSLEYVPIVLGDLPDALEAAIREAMNA